MYSNDKKEDHSIVFAEKKKANHVVCKVDPFGPSQDQIDVCKKRNKTANELIALKDSIKDEFPEVYRRLMK